MHNAANKAYPAWSLHLAVTIFTWITEVFRLLFILAHRPKFWTTCIKMKISFCPLTSHWKYDVGDQQNRPWILLQLKTINSSEPSVRMTSDLYIHTLHLLHIGLYLIIWNELTPFWRTYFKQKTGINLWLFYGIWEGISMMY